MQEAKWKLAVREMDKNQDSRQQQMEKNAGGSTATREDKRDLYEGLPLKDSPYTNYTDLEDYKQKGYGTQGHLEPKPGRGAGATDAPTLSGGAVSSDAGATATDAIHRQGVP